jgi:hypothetical protein
MNRLMQDVQYALRQLPLHSPPEGFQRDVQHLQIQ